MRIFTLIAVSALSIAAPALAQGGMMNSGMKSDSMMKMSAADTKMMNNCKAMPKAKMMNNAACMKMMKMHPDMMKGDKMMKSGH